MIVFIRCNDIISDSRAKKYLDFLNREHVDYRIIAWDRLGNSVKLPNAVYCPSKSKYNQGGVAAIIDRLKWMWFIPISKGSSCNNCCSSFSLSSNVSHT